MGDGIFEMGLCDGVKRERIPNLEEAHTLITCADRSIRHITEANWKLMDPDPIQGCSEPLFNDRRDIDFIRNANLFMKFDQSDAYLPH